MVEESFEDFHPQDFVRKRIEQGKLDEVERKKVLDKLDRKVALPVKTQPTKKKLNFKKPLKQIFSSKSIRSSKSAKRIGRKLLSRRLSLSRQSSKRSSLKKLNQMRRLQQLQQRKLSSQYNTNMREVVRDYDRRKQLQEFQDGTRSRKLSPNTQRMLQQLLRTQTKSNRDDGRTQRILRERRILQNSSDILRTPFVFNKYQFNTTGVELDNILLAKNIFKESPDNPSIMKSNRPSILDTKSAGNNIF